MSWPAYLWFFVFSGGGSSIPTYRATTITGANDSPANILGTNI